MTTRNVWLSLIFLCLAPGAAEAVDPTCHDETVKLVGPQGRVSLLQALPQSQRYGVALVFKLKDGRQVLAVGGGVTVGHVDLIDVAKSRYPNQIAGSQMWGEVKIENQSVKLGVGEITRATPTSGTWWKEYSQHPEHKNSAGGLIEALAAQEAIRVRKDGVRDFDAKEEHLSPMLVGRHRASSIVAGVTMKIEAMTTNWSGAEVTEADFKRSYDGYAPTMPENLKDFGLYLDGMVNDGALSRDRRLEVQKEIDGNFGPGSSPNVASMKKLYATLEEVLKPAADISRNPAPYIEFIEIETKP